MKYRIYTYNGTSRVLHTAYTTNEADIKFADLVSSNKYDSVEVWLGGYKPLKHWHK